MLLKIIPIPVAIPQTTASSEHTATNTTNTYPSTKADAAIDFVSDLRRVRGELNALSTFNTSADVCSVTALLSMRLSCKVFHFSLGHQAVCAIEVNSRLGLTPSSP